MSDAVKKMQAQAANDYRRHQDPNTAAEARNQSALARTHGNEAGGTAGAVK
ncbi:hypothetical protein ACFXKX_35780 [Streptomyces scopuliridis]|uniref:hypothetical protein n=1 Tax=Streptomyces scopuliridis TaxID=452529 RepID=UPI0036A28F41